MRFLRFIFGVSLLPLAAAVTIAVFRLLCGLHAASSALPTSALEVLGGIGVWLAAWVLLPHATRTYVLGHELTHAVWGLAFGAKPSALRVGENGGSVKVTKSNVWITLAPYFFPFYTMLVLAAYGITGCFVRPIPWPGVWLFAIGFTWAFHLTFTIQSLLIRQPDIMEYGRIFSYSFIYILNILGIGVWIVCASAATFATLGREIVAATLLCYGATFRGFGWCFQKIADLIESARR